jgi:hypothetical protein
MNMNAISKTVAAAATPEVLGTVFQRFKGIVFYGGKGTAATANTSTAYIQLRALSADGTAGDWVDAMPVPSAGYSAGINVSDALHGSVYNASQIRVRVGTNGDGVVGISAT